MLVRSANLPDGRTGCDIAVKDGRIAEVAPAIEAAAVQEIDAAGCLATPPFVDSHFHMDAALSYGLPRVNRSGTLLEGIALWGELKPHLTVEAIKQRAQSSSAAGPSPGAPWPSAAMWTSATTGCWPWRRCWRCAEKFKPYLDLQLVAFPQDGYLRCPGSADNLKRALDMGVDVVGGIPHFERTMAEGAGSVKALCEAGGRARAAGGHALRRKRRPPVAPHRDPGLSHPAPGPAGAGHAARI